MERYKVLSAMLALKEFTVEDLAYFSKVKANTVSTILARESSFVQELGKQSTGRRGGQFIKYRLNPETINVLREEIKGLVGVISGIITSETEFTPKVPLGILAAEDGLATLGEAKTDEERRQILEIAMIDVQGARADIESMLIGGANSYSINLFEDRLTTLEGEILQIQELYAIKEAVAVGAAASFQGLNSRHQELDASESEATQEKTLLWMIGERVGRCIATMQDLASKRSFNRLSREWAGLEDPVDQVYVIDGIGEEPDPLTNNVLLALQGQAIQQSIRIVKVGQKGMSGKLYDIQSGVDRRSMCLLTVDSNANPERAEATCKKVFSSFKDSGGVFVFDNGSSPILRNWMGHTHYVDHAQQVRPDVIRSTLSSFRKFVH
jgi:hypothetical protein